MNKLYLCTVGASMANKLSSLDFNAPWDDDSSKLERELDAKVRAIDYKTDVDSRRRLSAELNSLDRAGIDKDDFVALLASDTAACRVCAEKLKKILIDSYGLDNKNVRITRVEGLQTSDTKRMRKLGLNNFVKEALKYIDGSEYAPYDVVLNATGGFKCVVPFLTILGMLYRKPSIYVFEGSNELLRIPPLPFSFDVDLFARMRKALLFLEENVAATEEQFVALIDDFTEEERSLFVAFTEKFDDPNRDDLITVSPLAFSLVEIEKQAENKPVMIGRSALEELKEMTGDSKNNLTRAISHAQSPLWRAAHYHEKIGVNKDLLVYKPGSTAERFVGYIKDDNLRVVKLYKDHDDYLRGYSKKSGLKKDSFSDEEFSPWDPEMVES